MMNRPWQMWIDTGGTFTDCIAVDPHGEVHRAKVLSSSALRGTVRKVIDERTTQIGLPLSLPDHFLNGFRFRGLTGQAGAVPIQEFRADESIITLAAAYPGDLNVGDGIALESDEEAPVLAARIVTGVGPGRQFPGIEMRLATTRATNALLERRGSKVAFFVTKGLADLLLIGDQTRPDLFALHVRKPPPLYARVIEVDERLDANAEVLRALDLDRLERDARAALDDGIRAAAVALLHGYRNPEHERRVAESLASLGFAHISCSSDLAPLIRILPRAETTVVNAYVSEAVEDYVANVRCAVKPARLRVMTSAGGLADAAEFRAKDCLLSGPAGGVVGAAEAARRSGFQRIIGFDMGGTSTDVCRFDGDFDYRFEHRVGDARIMAPALSIETVAAGGGSICRFEFGRALVGPHSAGAHPGPACYGAGGPLTLTDVNLLLGRLDPDQFEIPIDVRPARDAFEEIVAQIEVETGPLREISPSADRRHDRDELLEGFLAIADDRMADAIAQISVRQGIDPQEYALVSFGGAGGQHACRVAARLGIETIIMPAEVSLLSAFGLGHAVIERFAERQILRRLDEFAADFDSVVRELAERATADVESQGVERGEIEIRRTIVNARLLGQSTSLPLDAARAEKIEPLFRERYRGIYGHEPEGKPIEIETVRVIASSRAEERAATREQSATYHPDPDRRMRGFFGGRRREVPAFQRRSLQPGAAVTGPAVIFERGSTLIVEDGWRADLDPAGALVLRAQSPVDADRSRARTGGMIQRDLFANRFTAIAREMGEQLQRTALSTNVKERRDFSCALLDRDGHLLVHAPHMPVHLGALGMCVRAVREAIDLKPSDVAITNHPAYGGSHLPDVTVITPIHDREARLIGYAANRAHHAEIGGACPGSMPPYATRLSEEGVVIPPTHLIAEGRPHYDRIETMLRAGRFPSRAVDDNLADIRAQVAANRRGADAMRDLADQHGTDFVLWQMQAVFDHAAGLAAVAVRNLRSGCSEAVEVLDDGSQLRVAIEVDQDSVTFDFSGTSPTHPGNLNATPAIVHSVVIYVLRVLIGEALPLNEGLMRRVAVQAPRGSMLNPIFDEDPAKSPAVVGGNVETSQRLVDVLFKALGVCAASQGTMNNTLFGNERFAYYETLCGGTGAGPGFDGADAAHSHMTNTRLTDPEILEHRFPVRLERFAIRPGSGGAGRHRGGDGVTREIVFLDSLELSFLTQRRRSGPFGLGGGEDGMPGRQRLLRADGQIVELEPVGGCRVAAGDRLVLETPGGGGWGSPTDSARTKN